ncbi:MAG: hypothetical protein IPJ26_17575 [Bacteroidetes bacterium]|nr:hypothetical protein [Bacteroidota bacterium]
MIKIIEEPFTGQLKTLAGQTVVYGLSSILVGYSFKLHLVPIYTRILLPAEYRYRF